MNQTIAVSGVGTAASAPDLAVLDIGVEVRARSIAAARAAASEAMEAVLDALREGGVADSGLTTTTYRIHADYDHRAGRRLQGYSVTNMVAAEIEDLDSLGSIIDSATEAGSEHIVVRGIHFAHRDPVALESEARSRAWQDAKRKAQQLAALGGVGLGDVVAMSEQRHAGGGPSPVRALAAEAAAAPVETGERAVTIAIQVEFEID